jgi:hypothetical protein
VERFEKPPQSILACPAFDRERPLTHRGQHDIARQNLGCVLGEAEPLEPAQREHHRVDLSAVELLEPRVHIAADRHDHQIGPLAQQLRLPAQRRRADLRILRQGR